MDRYSKDNLDRLKEIKRFGIHLEAQLRIANLLIDHHQDWFNEAQKLIDDEIATIEFYLAFHKLLSKD